MNAKQARKSSAKADLIYHEITKEIRERCSIGRYDATFHGTFVKSIYDRLVKDGFQVTCNGYEEMSDKYSIKW